jgi:hypothetical protein
MLAVLTRSTAMFRTPLPNRTALRSIFMPHRDIGARTDAGPFYIGLGDRFDDDRRLVRARTETGDVAAFRASCYRPLWLALRTRAG